MGSYKDFPRARSDRLPANGEPIQGYPREGPGRRASSLGADRVCRLQHRTVAETIAFYRRISTLSGRSASTIAHIGGTLERLALRRRYEKNIWANYVEEIRSRVQDHRHVERSTLQPDDRQHNAGTGDGNREPRSVVDMHQAPEDARNDDRNR